MITILLILALLISLGLNVATYIIIQNLLKKTEIYEKWILEFKADVNSTLENMRAMDKEGIFATSVNPDGMFESDDHVGQIFKGIMALIEKLNQRTR